MQGPRESAPARMRLVYWTRLSYARETLIDRLQGQPGIELQVVDSLPALLAALPGAQVLVLYDAPQDEAAQVVAALRAPDATVRWMHFISAGREGFEAAGLPVHLPVTYTVGCAAPVVAEHAMALLLALARRMGDAHEATRERRWELSLWQSAQSVEGQCMVVVGFGRIGQEVARRARAFGIDIVALSRSGAPHALADRARPLSELHAALGEADIVLVSIALTAETHHLLDAAAFAACKRGARIVNVARGGVIDQVALREALRSGHLGGAGLDVADPEPLPADDPLWDAPNLLVSAHVAGAGSPMTESRMADNLSANIRRFMAGEALRHRVDS